VTQLTLSEAGADYRILAAILNDNPTLTWRGWWNRYDARTQPPGAFQQFRRETLASDDRNGLAQFQRAMAFLGVSPRIKSINRGHSTYGWKHAAERWNRSRNEDRYADVYVGEGCFIAACIASGVTIRRRENATYANIAERASALGARNRWVAL